MTRQLTFDDDHPAPLTGLEEGRRRKDRGMQLAADSRRELLELARELAASIARGRESREVTADDVQAALIARGHGPHDLGNAAGSIFKGQSWQWTGRLTHSNRPHAHANLLRVWRYTGN